MQGDFQAKVTSGKLVIVDFYADWCGPCKNIAPKYEELSKKYPNVDFCKVNVDENEETSEKQAISAMPTFRVYKGATKHVDEVVGANIEKLEELIKKHLKW